MSNAPTADNRPGILVVDDTPINLQLLTSLLQGKGYRPRPVTSGKAAIAAALAEEPDLVILDISMPEMNGYTVCERFKADPKLKDIPILFLSALSEMEDKVKGLKVGGADFITKPFRIEEIEARVNAHLRVRSLQRQLRDQNAHLEQIVAERTRQLDEAYQRLQSLDKVKDDFLLMIAHEMRTPSNGILGVGELVIELCPPSAERDEYKSLFESSRDRLIRLLDDVALLSRMEQEGAGQGNQGAVFQTLLLEACASHGFPCPTASPETAMQVRGEMEHLTRVIGDSLRIAACFLSSPAACNYSLSCEHNQLLLRLSLDKLPLQQPQCDTLFVLASDIRTRSAAESLGLAPVVTHRLLLLLGGGIQLQSEGNGQGHLILTLPLCCET